MIKYVLSFAVFLFMAAPALAQEDEITGSQSCMAAIADLDEFLLAQSNTCVSDDECAGFYFRLDICAPPVMLTIAPTRTPQFMDVLGRLQTNARTACAAELKTRPKCTPKPYMPACSAGTCVNVWGRQE